MTHPSVEEVAEHLAGVLEPRQEERVRAHLEHCNPCAATAGDLAEVPDRLRRAAATTPQMPPDLASRIDTALAEESRHRTGRATGDDALQQRRRRRRRVAAGGLLAAAAATVVAVSVGDLLQTGSGNGATGGSAGSAATAQRPSGRDAAQEDLRGPTRPDELGGPAIAGERLAGAGLVDAVAERHVPGSPRHDRPACVSAALGRTVPAAASYAVRLPRGGNGSPGVVVLRPSDAPIEGLLVACAPQPRVLLRRGLAEPRE